MFRSLEAKYESKSTPVTRSSHDELYQYLPRDVVEVVNSYYRADAFPENVVYEIFHSKHTKPYAEIADYCLALLSDQTSNRVQFALKKLSPEQQNKLFVFWENSSNHLAYRFLRLYFLPIKQWKKEDSELIQTNEPLDKIPFNLKTIVRFKTNLSPNKAWLGKPYVFVGYTQRKSAEEKPIYVNRGFKLNGLIYDPSPQLHLTHADLSHMNLDNADFKEANLDNTNFSESNLVLAEFNRASLRNGLFRGNCQYGGNVSHLKRTQCPRANFQHADLTSADFTDTNLNYANFEGAILRGANLSGTLVENIKLLGADLRDAHMDKSLLNEVIKTVDNFSENDFFNPLCDYLKQNNNWSSTFFSFFCCSSTLKDQYVIALWLLGAKNSEELNQKIRDIPDSFFQKRNNVEFKKAIDIVIDHFGGLRACGANPPYNIKP